MTDDSTIAEKLTVCGTSFAISCAAFFTSVLVLVPATAGVCEWLNCPELVTKTLVLVEILGAPIVGALFGIGVGVRLVFANRRVVEGAHV